MYVWVDTEYYYLSFYVELACTNRHRATDVVAVPRTWIADGRVFVGHVVEGCFSMQPGVFDGETTANRR